MVITARTPEHDAIFASLVCWPGLARLAFGIHLDTHVSRAICSLLVLRRRSCCLRRWRHCGGPAARFRSYQWTDQCHAQQQPLQPAAAVRETAARKAGDGSESRRNAQTRICTTQPSATDASWLATRLAVGSRWKSESTRI